MLQDFSQAAALKNRYALLQELQLLTNRMDIHSMAAKF